MTPSKLNSFLTLKLPSAFICGVRVKEITNDLCVVGVKHRWINQNPFKSMYFAVQSMASELSTGALLIKKLSIRKEAFSMLVVKHEGEFVKKATGRIRFVCEDGHLVDDAIDQALETGEGVVLTMRSTGRNEDNQIVSNYNYTWSIKKKTKR